MDDCDLIQIQKHVQNIAHERVKLVNIQSVLDWVTQTHGHPMLLKRLVKKIFF